MPQGGAVRAESAIGQYSGMRLDHISYACSGQEVADVVQRIGSDLGATFYDGGRHPSFGTRNFIMPLADGAYIEVVSALDHPAALKAPFGQAVHQRADDGGGWLSWVLSVDDISPIEGRLGRESAKGHRIRPDGVELCWNQLGVLDLLDNPHFPFFVEWSCQDTEHPSAGGGSVRIDHLEICGDSEEVASYIAGDLAAVPITWVEAEEPGVVAVWFSTPHGLVRID